MDWIKMILDFIAAIAWQVTLLVVVYYFRNELRAFFAKAKKIELPGGFAVEIDKEILQAKELSKEVKKERKPELQQLINQVTTADETDANKRMVQLGLTPSPSGLDLNYYRKIVDADPRLALIGLRADLETMLKNLAKGFKILVGEKEPVSKIVSNLSEKGAITSRQREFINTLFKICNLAAHGSTITKEQAFEVLDIGEVLVKEYIAWLSWGFKQ